MADFEKRYYKYVKSCLTFCGLWFDQNVYKRQIFHIIWYIVNLSLLLPQIAMLVKEYKNITILMDNTIHVLFFTGGSMKYSITVYNIGKMKDLYMKIASDWKNITIKSERTLLERYNQEGLWLSTMYMILITVTCLTCIVRPFLPLIANLIIPLENGTRPIQEPLYSDYIFFNQSDYLYWISAYVSIVYAFFVPYYSGFDSFLVLTIKHVCGLFAITRYRIETALGIFEDEEIFDESLRDISSQTKCWQNLIKAVILHDDTIRSAKLLEDSFNASFLIIIVLCSLGLGVSATFTIYAFHDCILILAVAVLETSILIYLYCMNWTGQHLINSSEQVFKSAYFSNWHVMQPSIRRYILIIMIRSYNPSKLTAGKLVDLSMETFRKIIKNTLSYITVFLSLMQAPTIMRRMVEERENDTIQMTTSAYQIFQNYIRQTLSCFACSLCFDVGGLLSFCRHCRRFLSDDDS